MTRKNKVDSEDHEVREYRRHCTAIAEAEQQSLATSPAPPYPNEAMSFPHSVISGVARDFAALYGSYLEAPREFFYMAFLTCLGTILSPLLTLDSEITPEPRLFTLLLGESADDRKSTAISKTVSFFAEVFPQQFHTCWGVGSAEGLQKKLEHTEGEGLLLCLDEFKQFINKCKVEASVLLPCTNTLFESKRYESQTKKSAIEIVDAHLSLLAASTVQTFQNVWLHQFTDIGFNNRLFIVPGTAERRFAFPRTIPLREKNRIQARLRGCLRWVGSGKRLKINNRARPIYEEYYLNLERSIHSKRLDIYALRLMSLIAVSDNKREIDEETISKVVELCTWQLAARRLYDPIDAENALARMEEKVRRQLSERGPLTERELKQRTNARRSGLWTFTTALNNLQRAGEIALVSQGEKRWSIRPESNL